MKSLGWTFDPSNGQLTDGMGAQWYVKLVKITALASNGDKFEYKEPVIKWTAYENAPGPETMSVEEVDALVAELDDMIEAKNTEIEGLEEGSTALDNANAELEELEAERANACEYTTCVEQNSGSASDVSSSGLDMTVIGAVIAVIIIALLSGLLFMRGGNVGTSEKMVDWANELPANDAVANSMYGGAQEIFQQPVATPVAVAAPAPVAAVAPVVPQVPPGALPLPPGGLPAGWSMEQWAYYGHQYQQ